MTALQRTWWCLLSGTNMHKFNDKPNTCGRVDCVSMSGLPFNATSILSVIIIVMQIAVFLFYWIELTKVLARFLGHPKQDPSPVWPYKATSLCVHYPDPKIKITSPAIGNSWAVFYLTMLGFFRWVFAVWLQARKAIHKPLLRFRYALSLKLFMIYFNNRHSEFT